MRAYLHGLDTITLGTGRAEALARLEYRILGLIRPGIQGARLRIGTASVTTDAEGLGRACVEARSPFSKCPVSLEASDWHAPESSATVYVFDPARAVLVTDIDRTISDANAYQFLVRPLRSVLPYPTAPQVLGDLASRMHIIYLSARSERLLEKTRRWLEHFEFPPGPIFCRRFSVGNFTAERFKRETLRDLRKRIRIVAAIGDRDHDARAYADNGIQPILFRPYGRAENGRLIARHWNEIPALIPCKPLAE